MSLPTSPATECKTEEECWEKARKGVQDCNTKYWGLGTLERKWRVFNAGSTLNRSVLALAPNEWMESKVWKMVLIAAVALIVGFLGGTYYIQRDIEMANSIGIAARVIRQDKVLTYLEQGDVTMAKRAQGEYLRSSLLELGDEKSWPQEVQAIASKRKAQTPLK